MATELCWSWGAHTGVEAIKGGFWWENVILSLVFGDTTTVVDPSGQFQYTNIEMAEKQPDVQIPDDDNDGAVEPVNHRQAMDYAEVMDHIMDDFQVLLDKDWMDALEVTVRSLKHHMCGQFDSMQMADINIVIGCVKDP